MNWLWLLFTAFLFAIFLWVVEDGRIKERAEQEKKDLLRKKDKLLERQKVKERLRALLTRRYNWRLSIGYTALLLSFASLSLLVSALLSFGYDFEGLAKAITVVELVIAIVTLYSIRKPVEFKHILTQYAPFLKRRVFGKDINIDAEIKETKIRMSWIDCRVETLDLIIAM